MLDFLKLSNMKKDNKKPQQKNDLRGIQSGKKLSIIITLVSLMPKRRQKCWYNIPTTDTINDLYEEPEN